MPRLSEPRDEGFTLIELMVSAMLGVLVLGVASSILISMFRTEHTTSDFSGATTTGQLISRSVEEGVRNAAPAPAPDSTLASDPGVQSSVDANGELLRARVAMGTSGGTVTWQCQAWYFSPTTQTIAVATANTMIDDPAGFTWGAGHELTPNVTQAGVSWTLLGSNITPAAGSPLVFQWHANELDLNFTVTNGSTSLVLVPNVIEPRKIGSTGSGPDECYPTDLTATSTPTAEPTP